MSSNKVLNAFIISIKKVSVGMDKRGERKASCHFVNQTKQEKKLEKSFCKISSITWKFSGRKKSFKSLELRSDIALIWNAENKTYDFESNTFKLKSTRVGIEYKNLWQTLVDMIFPCLNFPSSFLMGKSNQNKQC